MRSRRRRQIDGDDRSTSEVNFFVRSDSDRPQEDHGSEPQIGFSYTVIAK
jgi:hypothetical protein